MDTIGFSGKLNLEKPLWLKARFSVVELVVVSLEIVFVFEFSEDVVLAFSASVEAVLVFKVEIFEVASLFEALVVVVVEIVVVILVVFSFVVFACPWPE